jgi:hypothetical protein
MKKNALMLRREIERYIRFADFSPVAEINSLLHSARVWKCREVPWHDKEVTQTSCLLHLLINKQTT